MANHYTLSIIIWWNLVSIYVHDSQVLFMIQSVITHHSLTHLSLDKMAAAILADNIFKCIENDKILI